MLHRFRFWLSVIFLSFAVLGTPAKAAKDAIIYEYETITQKKGESFDSALKKAGLSSYQTKLVKSVPIMHKALENRQLRFIYAVKNQQRLLREFRITRGKRLANYVLTGSGGNHRFVNKASQIPKAKLRPRSRLTSSSGNKTSSTTGFGRLTGIRVTQRRGQSLSSAWAPLRLTSLQRQIMHSGDYQKTAKSTRYFTLYFETKGLSKLLRGATVTRGNSRVDYVVRAAGKSFKLVNLKTLKSTLRAQLKKQFAAAKVVSASGSSKTSKHTSTTAKNEKSSQVSKKNSGGYESVSVTQRRGQSLSAAIRQIGLSSLQKRLVLAMPAATSAKSTRKIHLLFKGSGKNRRLKALRIVRGKQSAEYVLIDYKGKLTWADSKGRIEQSSSFKRYPLSFSRVSSRFNLRRRHPITRRIRPHRGIDLKAPHGTPIYAPANGVVTFAGRQRGYGILLEIDHKNGYKTKYGHLSAIARGIRRGTRVSKGKFIARVGNTGISTGAHLHYEIHLNGKARNPATVRLPGGGGTKTVPAAKTAANIYLPKLRRMTR